MSGSVSEAFLKQIKTRVALAAGRRVARQFVPQYHSFAAIRLSPAGPRRALARRQLARLVKLRGTES
jgi:hypothetical protein